MNREATIVRATGARPGGSCYRVLMWEEGALSDEELEAWQKERAALLTRMRDAGVKGARGTLAGLERELRELSTRAVEAPLATRGGAGLSRTRAEALAQTLAQEPGLLGYRITANSADILLELTGEEGVDALLRRWAEATPGTAWCKSPLIQVLQAAEAQERLAALEEESPAEDETDDAADDAPFHHVTVLAHEAVEALQPAEGRVMVDATLGGGGHSELLLQAGATVWGIDQDPAARRAARKRLAAYGDRLHIIPGNFRNAAQLLADNGVDRVDGILADIGISSPQVDCAERGFSFLAEGPLDMRMNPAAPRAVAVLLLDDVVGHTRLHIVDAALVHQRTKRHIVIRPRLLHLKTTLVILVHQRHRQILLPHRRNQQRHFQRQPQLSSRIRRKIQIPVRLNARPRHLRQSLALVGI